MNTLDYQLKYRRNLPHIQPKNATLFVTFRLHNSIPLHVLKAQQEQKRLAEEQAGCINDPLARKSALYLEQKRHFGRYDRYLDAAQYGPKWLGDPRIAEILAKSFHYRDEVVYRLDAFCIMSNHAHIVFAPLEIKATIDEDAEQSDNATMSGTNEYHSISSIMQSLKRYTAQESNVLLGRTGQSFWQVESYDHVVRDLAEWRRIIMYVLNNPVKAGLVASYEQWSWSYCKYL
ncbi:MAG: hypothetical protein AAF639_33655 [Chloroflexota bacterium]